jgi:adenine phosphoribosyltransferase
MTDLKPYIRNVPDFPKPGILFRDIAPLLQQKLGETIAALSDLLSVPQWAAIDAVAGIESRGFILAGALALRHGKGFVPIRKQGKLPPPVARAPYELEYGTGVLEMQPGKGRLLLVDDVLATGGTMTAAADLAITAGYEVSHLMALIDLNLVPGYTWRGARVMHVIDY